MHYEALREAIPSLIGKVFAITGTTSGTGFVAAQTVAEKGAKVLLLNRPSDRSKTALKKLKEAVPEGDFTQVDCDLQDFDSVRNAAKQIATLEGVSDLYCVAANAGVMALPNKATKDGYDIQMQTNHLSHFLLIEELFPLIVKGSERHGDARIVTHSSMARNMVPGKFLKEEYLGKSGAHLGDDTLNLLRLSGGCFVRYHHTKLANSVFCHALAKKLEASTSSAVRNIRSITAHPGVAATSLGDHLQVGPSFLKSITDSLLRLFVNSSEGGAAGLLYGMVLPDAKSDTLYGPKNNGLRGAAVPHALEAHETDEASCEMLWRKSEEATGVTFEV